MNPLRSLRLAKKTRRCQILVLMQLGNTRAGIVDGAVRFGPSLRDWHVFAAVSSAEALG